MGKLTNIKELSTSQKLAPIKVAIVWRKLAAKRFVQSFVKPNKKYVAKTNQEITKNM